MSPCLSHRAGQNGDTPTGVLRIERGTNKLISITIPFFFEKLADGSLSLPDFSSTVLPSELIDKFQGTR
jgi:hypothetical protein